MKLFREMIHVNQLNFRYKGAKENTLRNISFEIEKGKIYGFLGPSGAGKSTTQKILIRLLNGYEGDIRVMNKKLETWKNDYFSHVGVGFELPNHYLKLTAIENLRLFGSFYEKSTCNYFELLDMVGLKEYASQKVEDYSKGMKMRLNFVRALIHDPEILFFDEPTSGLDPINAHKVKDIIRNLKSRGKTIFLTTHNMHDADELCDRVAFIVHGEIMADEPPKDLKLKFGRKSVKVEYIKHNPVSEEFDLDKIGSNSSFKDILDNYPIVSIHSQEASLDEVFIKITGKSLI